MVNLELLKKSLTERIDEIFLKLFPNGKAADEECPWSAPAFRKITAARIAYRLSGFRG